MSKDRIQIQKIIVDYFENISDDKIINFIESFSYLKPTNNTETSKMIEKFIEDQGIINAYYNYVYDQKNNPSFFKSSFSEVTIIEDINLSLLNLSFNRLRNSIEEKKEKTIQEKKIENKIESNNKKNFNLLKRELLKCYKCLNNNESYFNGKEEDEEFINKINKLKYE